MIKARGGKIFYFFTMPIFAALILFLFSAVCSQPSSPQPDTTSRVDLLGPVNVTKIRTMDEVRGSYKSPKRAMFMSLVIPGSGQLYVGGQSRIIRGVFYIAEEAALIAGLYYYSVYKYGKQVSKYEKFAKQNFSVKRYEDGMNGIFDPAVEESFRGIYGNSREDFCKSVYGNNAGGSGSDCVTKFGNYTPIYKDGDPLYNSGEFYRIITGNDFALGWDGVELNPDAESNLYSEIPDASVPLYAKGTDYKLNEYRSLRKKANGLADRQAIFLGAIIVNHIVSAVDAALSARAHNNSLYEEKVSFLDKVRMQSDFEMGLNFKAGAALVYAF